MSQIQVKRTKKELARLLEDSEARNRMMKAHAQECEAQLAKWKPTNKTYRLEVNGMWFNYLDYETARTKMKALIDLGVIWFTVSEEPK